MTKLAGTSLDNLPDSARTSLAYESTCAHVTAAATVSARITTVLTSTTDRALTLPSAKAPATGPGVAFTLIKVDAAGSGKIVLTPASGEKIGAGAADATWSSPASAVNNITVVSNGTSWDIALQSGTWT